MYFVSATYFQPPCHPSVTFVSPKCPFCGSAAFQPRFSTEINSRGVFPPGEDVFHVMEDPWEV